jgi:sulfoacetaldehyde dehydrogenase
MFRMARALTDDEKAASQALLSRARAAMAAARDYDQARVDRLSQAIAWATANEATFGRLTRMSVEESGMGSAEGVPARRWKILGILRDALSTKTLASSRICPRKAS